MRRWIKAALALAAVPVASVAVACAATAPGGGPPADAGCSLIGRYASDAGGCATLTVQFSGDPAACGIDDAGAISTAGCTNFCGAASYACSLVDAGTVTCNCLRAGRRPEGLLAPETRPPEGALGGWLAAAAYLEAASTPAFHLLRDDLGRLGAPAALRRAATRAIGDERRHARAMRSLARQLGVVLPPAPVRLSPPRCGGRARPRTLTDVAVENAREGCIGETWGALVASLQAERATDARVRATLGRIAADEARHAALSWRLHAWAAGRLSPAGRRRVERALRGAAVELAREVGAGRSLPAAARRTLGLPSPAAAARAVSTLLAQVPDPSLRAGHRRPLRRDAAFA